MHFGRTFWFRKQSFFSAEISGGEKPTCFLRNFPAESNMQKIPCAEYFPCAEANCQMCWNFGSITPFGYTWIAVLLRRRAPASIDVAAGGSMDAVPWID